MGNRYLSNWAVRLCQTVSSRNGDVAQLVERLLCKQEVDGSIPFISTEEAAGHSVFDCDLQKLRTAIHFIGHFMAKQKETKCWPTSTNRYRL
jgi:hypothetical protein